METPKRQIAKITDIKSIMLGKYIKEAGWEPNYILTDDNRKLSRVNIIATVVGINEEDSNKSITVDDGSASTMLRTFENITLFSNMQIGDNVLIIGRPREFNDEKYVIAEIIKKIDTDWLKVRQKELNNTPKEDFIQTQKSEEEVIVDEVIVADEFDSALAKIKELDIGQGVETEKIIASGFEETIINKLLENGEIFEISPGKLKILE